MRKQKGTTMKIDDLYRRARARRPEPIENEDAELNRICEDRKDEPRYPIEKLLRKMGHEVER